MQRAAQTAKKPEGEAVRLADSTGLAVAGPDIATSRSRKRVSFFVHSLGSAIVLCRCPEAEHFPNAKALCQQFGVSRGTLREAVSVLATKGLVAALPGWVKPEADWDLLDTAVLLQTAVRPV